MPARMIRDGILTSKRINALSDRAELFYRRLMSVVDDYGRYFADPMLLRASCYPLKLDSVKEDSIKKHLAEAEDAGLIVLYTVAGTAYLEIQDFGQRVQSKPKFPERISGLHEPTVVHGESRGKTAIGGGEDGVGDEGDIRTPNGVRVRTSAGSPDTTAPMDRGNEPKGAGSELPPCPVNKIVDLYHESLPMLPRVVKLTQARRGQIQQRWREDLRSLDDWKAFFADISSSHFLTGRSKPRNGREPFRADLPWLTKAENFAKIAEGKYH